MTAISTRHEGHNRAKRSFIRVQQVSLWNCSLYNYWRTTTRLRNKDVAVHNSIIVVNNVGMLSLQLHKRTTTGPRNQHVEVPTTIMFVDLLSLQPDRTTKTKPRNQHIAVPISNFRIQRWTWQLSEWRANESHASNWLGSDDNGNDASGRGRPLQSCSTQLVLIYAYVLVYSGHFAIGKRWVGMH